MKLALVRRSYSAVGGAELYLQRLLSGLQASGHEIHLLAESWGQPPRGITLHTLPAGGSRSRRPWNFARAVQAHLDSHRYDCVFSLERTLRQDVYRAGDGVHRAWIAQRRRFSPWWRTFWTGSFHRAMMALERETLNPAHTRLVIANSEMVRQEIHRHFAFPLDRIRLVRNGVDVVRFASGRRDETRRQYGFAAADFVCLFVGSGWERKGLNYLLAAIQKLHGQARLLVAGKGKPLHGLSNVTFTGPVAGVENLYAAADLFTFVPIYEPSANVCIEAFAAGLPVITSRFNGAAELISHPELGSVLDDPSDIPALTRAIRDRLPRPPRIHVPPDQISLEQNVRATLAILESSPRAA